MKTSSSEYDDKYHAVITGSIQAAAVLVAQGLIKTQTTNPARAVAETAHAITKAWMGIEFSK